MSEKIKAFRPFHEHKMNPFQKLINDLFKSGDCMERRKISFFGCFFNYILVTKISFAPKGVIPDASRRGGNSE